MAEGTGSNKVIEAGVTILVAIVGVAALAVLVSRSANTSNVVTASSQGFAQMLCAALKPIGVSCGSLIPSVTSTITFGNPVSSPSL